MYSLSWRLSWCSQLINWMEWNTKNSLKHEHQCISAGGHRSCYQECIQWVNSINSSMNQMLLITRRMLGSADSSAEVSSTLQSSSLGCHRPWWSALYLMAHKACRAEINHRFDMSSRSSRKIFQKTRFEASRLLKFQKKERFALKLWRLQSTSC